MVENKGKFKFKKRTNASSKKKQLRRPSDHGPDASGGVKSEADLVKSDANASTENAASEAAECATTEDATDHSAEEMPSAEADAVASSLVKVDEVVPNGSVKIEGDTAVIKTEISDDDEDSSTLHKIRAMERRKKLLGTGRIGSRGMNAASLLQGHGSNANDTFHKRIKKSKLVENYNGTDKDAKKSGSAKNKDLEELLKGTFAGGKLAGSNDMGGDEDGGILAKKHKLAMEEFIRKNLQQGQEKSSSSAGGINEEDESESANAKFNANDVEKELYADILEDNVAAPAEGTEDVGAGGTMMAGTGIAEVALPIDERINALKETERAAMEYERARRARFGGVDNFKGADGFGKGDNEMIHEQRDNAENSSAIDAVMPPMSFAPGPGKRKRRDVAPSLSSQPTQTPRPPGASKPATYFDSSQHIQSSAIPQSLFSASSAGPDVQRSDVSTLGASYSHNFQLHTKEWVSRKKDERQTEIDAITAQRETEEGPPESRARVGFEMARKMAKGEFIIPVGESGVTGAGGKGFGISSSGSVSLRNEWDRKSGGDQRSNDDRVWKTFMSKQKNRR